MTAFQAVYAGSIPVSRSRSGSDNEQDRINNIMKIYIAHSNKFDFRNELYIPLRNSLLDSQHEIFLPHETDTFINTKEIIKKVDLVIAEVSYPATGEGIELGRADSFHIPIVCIYKEGTRPSGSLQTVTDTIVSYAGEAAMLQKIEELITQTTVTGRR